MPFPYHFDALKYFLSTVFFFLDDVFFLLILPEKLLNGRYSFFCLIWKRILKIFSVNTFTFDNIIDIK
jgi:hypothetical protein